jgi:hypothetical protein
MNNALYETARNKIYMSAAGMAGLLTTLRDSSFIADCHKPHIHELLAEYEAAKALERIAIHGPLQVVSA